MNPLVCRNLFNNPLPRQLYGLGRVPYRRNIPVRVKSTIRYDQIEQLSPYSDRAVAGVPKAATGIDVLANRLKVVGEDRRHFDEVFKPSGTIRISFPLYCALLFALSVLGITSCYFLCSLVKSRFYHHRYSDLSCSEKKSAG